MDYLVNLKDLKQGMINFRVRIDSEKGVVFNTRKESSTIRHFQLVI